MSAIAFLLMGGSAIAAYGQAQTRVESIFGSEPMRSGVCAAYAVRMNGEQVVNCDASRKLIPASTTKLISTGLSLKLLGPDFRYSTRIAYSGAVVDSVLTGDVYIIGGGDPLTAARVDGVPTEASLFGIWYKALKDAGISRVNGRVVADPRFFNDPATENPGWQLEDLGTGYGAAPSGLNFNENIQTFYIASGPSAMTPPIVSMRHPYTPWLEVRVNAITAQSASYDDLYCVNSTFAPIAEFRGAFPLGSRGYTLECSNRYAALTCAYRFCSYLSKHGVSVSGGYADIGRNGYLRCTAGMEMMGEKPVSESQLTGVCETFSLPLSELVRITNWRSDNFIAETLLRTIGLKSVHSCRYDSCYVAVSKLLSGMGVNCSNSLQLRDGSGLSRKNYISPEFFVNYLLAMSRTSVFGDFYDSLPVPGMDNTSLLSRFRNASDAVKSRVHMKSGSMDGVRCFCGYIDSEDHDPRRRIAFSVMTNNITAPSSTVYGLIEDIILAIMEDN